MKLMNKKLALVATAVLGLSAFAAKSQAGSVTNLIAGGIPPVINVVEDGSREGFFAADGVTPITSHVAIVPGDTIRAYFHVDDVNGVSPDTNQGVEWTAVLGLSIASITPGGFVTFQADPTFATQTGTSAGTAAVFYQDSSLDHNVLNINTYNNGQFFWSVGFVNANNLAVAQAFQPVFGDAGAATTAGSLIATSNFSFDLTGSNNAIPGMAAITGGLQTHSETGTIANGGLPGTITGQFLGFSNLSGSAGATPGTTTPNFAIIDNTHLDFAVFAPAPEAFWGGAALLGCVGAVSLLRRRTVAC